MISVIKYVGKFIALFHKNSDSIKVANNEARPKGGVSVTCIPNIGSSQLDTTSFQATDDNLIVLF